MPRRGCPRAHGRRPGEQSGGAPHRAGAPAPARSVHRATRSRRRRPASGGIGGHLHLDDTVRVADRLAALQAIDMLHALHHLAPDRVLAVEKVAGRKADEELAVRRVRILGACHRAGSALVRRIGELGLEIGLGRAAGAGARRVAALRHETFDDAVERHAVIEALAGQLLDAAHMAGRDVGPELDHHAAMRQIHIDGVLGVAVRHRSSYLISFWTFSFTILSGLAGGSPLLIWSTHSMPLRTLPNTV